jgi:hypothetical protein
MVAFSRELDDLQWYTARIPGISTVLRNIDAKTVKAGNGAAGSSHAVTGTQIVIGGQGMVCAGLWTLEGEIVTSASNHIRLGGGHSSDYVRLRAGHPGESRSMTVPILPVIPEYYLGAYASSVNNFSADMRAPGFRMLIAITPHDRSTLADLRLMFKINFAHAALPSVPKFRVVRVDRDGNVQALHTARSGSYKDDGYLDLPTNSSNVANYENGAAYQWSNLYEPDQFNTVDLANYAYYVDVIEESGTNAYTPDVTLTGRGTNILRGEMTCEGITLLAPQ